MQPYNYVLPQQGMMSAYGEGMQLRAAQEQLQANEDARKAKAEQLRAAMERAKLMQDEQQRFLSLPNASIQDVLRYSSFLPPDMVKAMQPQFEALGKEGQQGLLRFGGEVVSAIQGGRPEIAIDLLKTRAQAEKDPKQADSWNRAAQMMEVSPQLAFKAFAPLIAAMSGGKEMLESIDKGAGTARAEALQGGLMAKGLAEADTARAEATIKGASAANAVPMAEAALGKAQGDAQDALTKGKFSERNALAALEKSGWDIKKIQADITSDKEKNKIGWMNAQIGKETNGLKRDELRLKISEMQSDQDKRTRERVADVTDARRNIDNLLNTADRALKMPNAVIRAATGPIDARIPTIQRDVADFESLVETLGSQAFLSQLGAMKGLGALTEKEGDKLQSALQNLSLRQSDTQLATNIKEAQRLMLKARSNLSTRYGVPEVIPDTPQAGTNKTSIDALLEKYK